jgi:hypothetical protein
MSCNCRIGKLLSLGRAQISNEKVRLRQGCVPDAPSTGYACGDTDPVTDSREGLEILTLFEQLHRSEIAGLALAGSIGHVLRHPFWRDRNIETAQRGVVSSPLFKAYGLVVLITMALIGRL